MTTRRENLIDRMIRLYGYESEIVIGFCVLCEKMDDNEWNDNCLTTLVEAHESSPYTEIDEEDDE